MKFTNDMFQDSLTTAYNLIFSGPLEVDTSLAVNKGGAEIARYMAESAAKTFLEALPEDDFDAAVAMWNDDANYWLRQYIVSRMAERSNDESYTEEYRHELRNALHRLPLGIHGMQIDTVAGRRSSFVERG